jgi:hypothetical protein
MSMMTNYQQELSALLTAAAAAIQQAQQGPTAASAAIMDKHDHGCDQDTDRELQDLARKLARALAEAEQGAQRAVQQEMHPLPFGSYPRLPTPASKLFTSLAHLCRDKPKEWSCLSAPVRLPSARPSLLQVVQAHMDRVLANPLSGKHEAIRVARLEILAEIIADWEDRIRQRMQVSTERAASSG